MSRSPPNDPMPPIEGCSRHAILPQESTKRCNLAPFSLNILSYLVLFLPSKAAHGGSNEVWHILIHPRDAEHQPQQASASCSQGPNCCIMCGNAKRQEKERQQYQQAHQVGDFGLDNHCSSDFVQERPRVPCYRLYVGWLHLVGVVACECHLDTVPIER
jgi:hypothetical protein